MEAEYHLRVAGLGNTSYGTLGASNMMNLSTGNLAMANHDGKSVSTSALGTTTAASVDRWAVVMDLLAQSRKKPDKENADESKGPLEPGGSSSAAGKRHSKQLDKFKLAAKSAAAASKHQHLHYLQQRQQQLSPTSGAPATGQNPTIQDGSQSPQHRGGYSLQQQIGGANSNPLSHQYPGAAANPMHHHHMIPQVGTELTGPFIGSVVAPPGGVLSNANDQQTGAAMLLHHAKSLPVGKLAANGQQIDGGQQLPGAIMGNVLAPPNDIVQPGSSQQQQQQQPMPYQLLNIGAQQLQSTSGKSLE